MFYELWRKLEDEEDGEIKGRRLEIGYIFLLDRGKLCFVFFLFLDFRRYGNMENGVV